MSMKTIVCFGDSNTWGYVPGSDGERFSPEIRWPARLAAALGSAWEVIAEGLNGTERVVISAGAFLNPGQKIKPVLQARKG